VTAHSGKQKEETWGVMACHIPPLLYHGRKENASERKGLHRYIRFIVYQPVKRSSIFKMRKSGRADFPGAPALFSVDFIFP
jgi:hypothetical protein